MIKLLYLALAIYLVHCANGRSDTKKHYVVYIGKHSYTDSESVKNANHELLASTLGSVSLAKEATIYHYTKAFRGFSAFLTQEQAHQLSKEQSVVSVHEDKLVRLATSRSWDFMESSMFTHRNGGHENLYGQSRHHNYHSHPHNISRAFNETTFATKNLSSITEDWYYDRYRQQIFVPKSSDVVIGVIDGGIWPEAASFNDEGLGPIPSKFNYECLLSNSGSGCNRKIIRTRWYSSGYEALRGPLESDGRDFYRSARDSHGHGTHVASTAAGAMIRGSVGGIGDHTMRGGAPGARLAVYKACWWETCASSDIYAAYDDAINDKVDIISMSLGPSGHFVTGFFDDPFASVTLAAHLRGIFVSASGANDGLDGAVAHGWPWTTTVAASTIDRAFITPIVLGNSFTLQGYGLNQNEMNSFYRIITGEQAAADSSLVNQARQGSLYGGYVYGNIVICEWDDTDNSKNNDNAMEYVRQQGGVGVIFITDKTKTDNIPMYYPINSAILNPAQIQNLQYYLNSYREPVARILPSQQVINQKPEPRMTVFSNRGPNRITPELIKPDITAPGHNIVAASYAGRNADPVLPLRTIMSGTSMACPHVTGVATMIKDLHKDWSPATIKSAIMTTAYGLNNAGGAISSHQGNPATPFNYGSGHLNPMKALDPGLVYDFGTAEIAEYMCNFNNERWVRREFDMNIDCSRAQPVHNLNYPSISVASNVWPVTVTRTLTYVGGANQPKVFKAEIEAPGGAVRTSVEPQVIDFTNQKVATYTLTFMPRRGMRTHQFYFGSINWKKSAYEVRSPISIYIE